MNEGRQQDRECQRFQELIQLATLEMKGSIGAGQIRDEIKDLLERKQEEVIDFVNSNGDNSLQLACENPCTADIAADIIRTIGFGQKHILNNQNKHTGMTSLHTVCVRGAVELICLLLKYGADLSIQDIVYMETLLSLLHVNGCKMDACWNY